MVVDASARVNSVILCILRCFEVYSHSESVLGVEHWLRFDVDSLAGAQDGCLDGAVWCVAVVVVAPHQEVAIDLKTDLRREVAESESGVPIEALKADYQMGLVIVLEAFRLGGIEVPAVFDEATELTRRTNAVVQIVRRGVGCHLESGCWSCCRCVFVR